MKRVWSPSEIAALARFFSSSVVRELAHKGYSSLFGRLLHESGLSHSHHVTNTLGEFFDWAYGVLQAKDNRHEYIYKNALAQKVLLGRHSLNTSCMITEFRAGSCKADVVILNGTSTVYEIKSERDRLDRLEKQLHEYLKIFDQVQVITGDNHVDALERNIPVEVGIQVLTGRFSISDYRPPVSNIANVRPESIFESLQRSEYLTILNMYDITVPAVPNTRMHAVAKELFCSLTPEQAHKGMVEALKENRNPIVLREFILSVPGSLKAAAVSVPLSKSERFRFLAAMETRLEIARSWA
ncbi:MAG: sce7726 family protein [Armatimonadota bacterium]